MKIAIIGMMGTGKTAAGVLLAEQMSHSFADIDDIIVYKVGMPISQAYIYFGEKTYRSYETSALFEVLWHDDIVICCGGGVPLNSENMQHMQDFIKVRLTADPQEIYRRISGDVTKTLMRNNTPQAIANVVAEREQEYAGYADITVDTTSLTPQQTADEIVRQLKQKGLV